MSQADFADLLRRYLDGACSAAEQQLVEGWYDALGATRPMDALPEAERAALQARLWQRLAARTVGELPLLPPGQPALPPLVRPRLAVSWRRSALRWVAGLAVVLGTGAGWWTLTQRPAVAPLADTTATTTVSRDAEGYLTHLNRTSRVLRVRLPDGSVAALSPAASLRFPTQFGVGGRAVRLRGEAFFWVEKNPTAPFQVFTDKLVTTVLGTSFRVREGAAGEPVVVAVRTGRVAVAPRLSAVNDPGANAAAETGRRGAIRRGRVDAPALGVLVLPNQQAVYSAATGRVRAELVDKPVVLVPRSFVFEERPVTEVLAALKEAYGVRISYDAARLRTCTVNVTFYDEPLFEKLGILCKTLGAYYQVEGTRIVLRSRGCGGTLPASAVPPASISSPAR